MVDLQRCEGCATCIDQCPMSAIHLPDGKAAVIEGRCIDCGQCIASCPRRAIGAVTDTLESLSEHAYRIALLAPSLEVLLDSESPSGEVSSSDLRSAFSNLGFNEVFEVAHAARVVAFIVERHIEERKGQAPLLTTSCPAALRLVQTRFPGLMTHTARVLSPMEVAARLAKEAAAEKTGLSIGKIGAFFISPCPAKVTETEKPILTTRSAVNGVIGIDRIYGIVAGQLAEKGLQTGQLELPGGMEPETGTDHLAQTVEGGRLRRLKVSGIPTVIGLLEEMERGRPIDTDLIELHACAGGCLGGPLNPRNPLEETVDVGRLIEKYRRRQGYYDDQYLLNIYKKGSFESTAPVGPGPTETPEQVGYIESH
jgi:iron only hydrogenase large subunit-like protein